MQNYLLHPDERFVAAWKVRMTEGSKRVKGKGAGDPPEHGYLLLTNQRLGFLHQTGVITKTYPVAEVVGLEMLVNVSVQGVMKNLRVSFSNSGSSVERIFTGLGKEFYGIQNTILQARGARIAGLEQEKKQARVQYILDFSFLKAQMEKGGITVSTVRCPSCHASLTLPESGTSARCSHCGANVVAADVFERMKGLIGDLP
jgi:hypothetical protein